MKILTLSDLHLESSSFTAPLADVDVVVLAGDIHKGNLGIFWARETWPDKHLVYVAGNHEFYNQDRVKTLENLRCAADEMNVHFLENDGVMIDGVRFLGCTLWTDFDLFGAEQHNECLSVAKDRLCDFSMIQEKGFKFTPEASKQLHCQSKEWLSRKLIDEHFEGKTVVVTHHCPSWESVAQKYRNDLLSACFSSHLDDLIGYSSIWIHGHTHLNFDYEIKGTRVICNPRGYVFRNVIENVSFDSCKIIHL